MNLKRLFSCFFAIFVFSSEPFTSLAYALDPMDDYLGRWVGHYRIHDSVSDATKVVAVEQRYWEEEGQVRALAVVSSDAGMVSSSSIIYRAGGVFITEVERGETVEQFLGRFEDGRMSWYSSDPKRTHLYKMDESILMVDGMQVLRIEGFDIRETDQGEVEITYQGALVKQPD